MSFLWSTCKMTFAQVNLAVPRGNEVVPLINRLATKFQHVVLTQDWHPRGHHSFASSHGKQHFQTIDASYGTQILWPDHCVQHTAGAAFHDELHIPHADGELGVGDTETARTPACGGIGCRHAPGPGHFAITYRTSNVPQVRRDDVAHSSCAGWTRLGAAHLRVPSLSKRND